MHFEDLGSFGHVLADRGFEVTYLDAGRQPLRDAVEEDPPQLLVVLGGPVGVYERDSYPFLSEELDLLRRHLDRELPVLGVCLGAQLVAAALGAAVYPGNVKELGWGSVELTATGHASPLAGLTDPVLHWHGDTFDLPPGAERLASTAACANQAFSAGPRVLGLQFHAEVLPGALESWLIGHAVEIAQTPGVSVADLRAGALRHGSRLAAAGRRLLGQFLDEALDPERRSA